MIHRAAKCLNNDLDKFNGTIKELIARVFELIIMAKIRASERNVLYIVSFLNFLWLLSFFQEKESDNPFLRRVKKNNKVLLLEEKERTEKK